MLDRVTHSTHGLGLLHKEIDRVPVALVLAGLGPVIAGLRHITSARHVEPDLTIPPFTSVPPSDGAHVGRAETHFLLALHHRDGLAVEDDPRAHVSGRFHGVRHPDRPPYLFQPRRTPSVARLDLAA